MDESSRTYVTVHSLLLGGAVKHVVLLAFVVACVDSSTQPIEATSELEQAAIVCGRGPTVKGIDVSYYQGTINWAQVKASGVAFAFIRVSDGSFQDPNFATYWAGSRAAHVIHGAYHFFRPALDPIVQADAFLAKLGTMKADDLPPVLDVEAADGKTPAQVAAGVKAWVNHVKTKLGRPPIIYTGKYFWQDSVGGVNLTSSPLWHAQYTTAACPDIASPWTDWAIWQYSSSGSVPGISGNVDVDHWNGDRASFDAFLGPPGTCGDSTCNGSEDQFSCPEDCGACGTIEATGGVVDDGDTCFVAGGPATGMRQVKTDGMDGDLVWTHATATVEENFSEWNFNFAEAGRYKIEVYTAATFAQSKKAKYVVHASGADHDVTLDQSAVDGYQSLGDFDFAQGAHQFVHLGDSTGEPVTDNVQLVFDAVRVTRIDDGMGSGSGSDMTPPNAGGCSTSGGSAGFGILLAFTGLAGGRRKRRG
ncbi:MAG: uncharacterized protein JWO36_1294 [Myxococcales bacterium]|nr:uncharacterized protein [Myxococcales bacterium]